MQLEPPSVTHLMLDFLATAECGRMTARELCRRGMAMGHAEPTVRVALTRLVQQNKIHKVERGTYVVHPSHRSLHDDVEHWFNRLEWVAEWAGGWVGVLEASTSGMPRAALRRHRRALHLRGFREWKPGFFLRPDNLRGGAPTMRAQLQDLGLMEGAQVFLASDFASAGVEAIKQLWDVEALHAKYDDLLGSLAQSEADVSRMDDISGARETLLIGRHVISQIVSDPLLPEEMMDAGKYRLLIERMHAYQALSRSIWARVLGQDL